MKSKKRQSITVAGQEFSTKKELESYTQSILKSYSTNTYLNQDDQNFVLELLKRHPKAEEKIGVGVRAIKVWMPPPWSNYKGFFLVRMNGSGTDFSYKECITSTTKEKKCKEACRSAIYPQIVEFRTTHLDRYSNQNGQVWCPAENRFITLKDIHIDHEQPSFDELFKTWLESRGIDVEEIQILPHSDGDTVERMADSALEIDWQEFHHQQAKLQVLSKTGNLTKKRKPQH